MIKRLLPIFLSVCYVFAGERPSPIESNAACVAKGRVVLNDMSSCTEVVDSGTCVATDARIAKNTPDEVPALKNPWFESPMHQNPPLFKITLPGGQVIVILGTTHTIPLSYILPECLVEDLIKQSVFTFNEIWGELLKGGPSKVDSHFGLASLFRLNSPADSDDSLDFDNLPDFCYMSKDYREKIKDCTIASYEPFYAKLSPELLESQVAKHMDSIFDENGKWYEKAGIVLQNETDDLQPTHLVIKVNGRKLEVPVGKELHPAVLRLVAPYQLPLCGGMDNHLDSISFNAGKPIFALEQESERPGLIRAIENSDAFIFKFQCVDLEYSLSIFYSDELPNDKSPGLLERNNLWVLRIMELVKEDFKLAFGYVGRGHLKDLFKKLEENKCKVERLSLAKLQGLLNEQTLSREGGGC